MPFLRCQLCGGRAVTRRYLLWGHYDLCRECADAFDRTR